MEQGKAPGVRCVQLTKDNLCKLFGKIERPKVCSSLQASSEMCGNSNEDAMEYLTKLEAETCSEEEQTD